MRERRIYKAYPNVDGGLCGHVPARPGYTTPQIRFLGACPVQTGSPRSRNCGMGFLQTTPLDDALALLLTFGSTNTWYRDLHPVSYVPCPAHTFRITG